jgi:hypothetical protein
MEVIGNSTATRKLRIQAFNGSSAYAQWYMDGGNMQIYGEVNGVRNFLMDSTTAYLRWAGVDRLWGGSDGTRNSGWAYHVSNDTGLHWPNNGWHLMPASNSDFRIYSGNSTDVSLRFETAGTTRGYVYAENDNTIGFLTNGRSWAFRTYSNGDARVYGYLYVNGAGTSSSIMMSDSDEGQREIHCNSQRIGFLTQAGNWGAWCNDNGSFESVSSVTTNDWFYTNGGGGLYFNSYSRGLRDPAAEGNSYGNITTYGSGRNGWQGWGIGTRHVFMSTGGDNVGVHDNSRGWIWYWNGSFTSFDFGYTQFAGSARSPIFYDNNDTGYYVDPNSTSRMNRTNYDYVYSYNWIYAQGDIVAYYSDERLKTKTGNIENALDKIKQLNGFYYTNNDLAKSFGYKEEKTQVGLSAQEVQSVLPEVVTLAPFDTEFDENNQSIGSKSGENYLTVNYDKLVPLLIEAIKEQQSQIEELKSKLDGLTK